MRLTSSLIIVGPYLSSACSATAVELAAADAAAASACEEASSEDDDDEDDDEDDDVSRALRCTGSTSLSSSPISLPPSSLSSSPMRSPRPRATDNGVTAWKVDEDDEALGGEARIAIGANSVTDEDEDDDSAGNSELVDRDD